MEQIRPTAFSLVGPGRAGSALAARLVATGWRAAAVAGRSPDAPSTRRLATRLGVPAVAVADAGADADLLVLATPDAALETVGGAVAPGLRPGALVVHLAGARGLDVLAPIAQTRPDVSVGALHPLQTLTGTDDGDALAGAWAAVAGPGAVAALAAHLGLRPFRVDDDRRPAYHAAAAVASNHLVALLGQVERLAAVADVPLAAFEPLVRASVDHVFAVGPEAALTGPVARGDVETVSRHLAAIPADEQRAYRALADAACRLRPNDDSRLREVLA